MAIAAHAVSKRRFGDEDSLRGVTVPNGAPLKRRDSSVNQEQWWRGIAGAKAFERMQPEDTVFKIRSAQEYVGFGSCFTHSVLAVSAGHNPRIRLISATYPSCVPVREKFGPQRTCHVSAELYQSGRVLSGPSLMMDQGEVRLTILD